MQITERNIETSFGPLYYLQTTAKGNPIVWFHGGYGSPRHIYRLGPYFTSHGYRIIAPYLPGHGKSLTITHTPNYNSFLNALVQFTETFRNESLIVGGHSLGARLAIDIGQVLGVKSVISSAPILQPLHKNFITTGFNIAIDRIKANDKAISQVQIDSPHYSHIRKFWQMLQTLEPIDIKRMKSKILFLWGKEDRVLPYKNYEETIENFPNKEIKLFDGGHYYYLNKQQPFCITIEKFLSRTWWKSNKSTSKITNFPWT